MTRAWVICTVFAVGCGASRTTPAGPPPDPLDGVWGVEVDLGPALAGSVQVSRDHAAQVGGVTAVLRDESGEWRGTFAPSGAELRLRGEGDTLRGFWIQPPSTTLQTGYATPLVLEPVPDGWAGQVAPLRDRLRLYLTIAPGPQGTTAWVRETETNFGRMLGQLTVAPARDGIEFRTSDGEVAFTGQLTGDRLALHIDAVGLDLELTRRTRATATGLYPRPDDARVALSTPSPSTDGWATASLEEVGLDRAPVEALVQRIVAGVPTEPASPAIHSLLIARHGALVVEEYFAGASRDDVHDLRSAGKSFTTTLLGIAADQGLVAPDDLVADILGHVPGDVRRDALQVRHLASMSSGLACDDKDASSPGNEDVMQGQRDVTDWYRYTWDLPFVRDPGAQAVYCTGAINLIGAVLGRATGRWLPALFDGWLARSLDITRYHWNLMPTGEGYLGGGARLRPRDFAKLAQLVVGGGTWRGRRVVSEAWIATATAAHGSINAPDDYGFGWWRRRYQVAGDAIDVVYASGNGAQLAIAVPQLDLVVSVTAGNYGQAAIRQMILDTWLPALLEAAHGPRRRDRAAASRRRPPTAARWRARRSGGAAAQPGDVPRRRQGA